MAEGLNKVILIGNLGQDPELRFTQGGTAILNMRLATNESWTQDGERKEKTEWHTVILWGKRGEALSKFLSKGKQLCVEGRLQTRKWEAKDGGQRQSTEIVASNIILLGSGGGGGGGRTGGGGHEVDPGPSENDYNKGVDDGQGFGDDDIPF